MKTILFPALVVLGVSLTPELPTPKLVLLAVVEPLRTNPFQRAFKAARREAFCFRVFDKIRRF